MIFVQMEEDWKKGVGITQLPFPSLTWNLNMMVSKRNLLFQGAIFQVPC